MITLTSVPVCNDQVLLGNHLLALNNPPVADANGMCGHDSCVSANCKTKLNVDNLGIDHRQKVSVKLTTFAKLKPLYSHS